MILQLMSEENLPDDSDGKRCKIIDYINEVSYQQLGTGEMTLAVQYTKPNRELMAETFVLSGNAYLLNDSGKTIKRFAASPTSRIMTFVEISKLNIENVGLLDSTVKFLKEWEVIFVRDIPNIAEVILTMSVRDDLLLLSQKYDFGWYLDHSDSVKFDRITTV